MTLLETALPASASEHLIVLRHDRTLVEETLGDADAVFALLCISKPIVALAAMRFLLESPDLDLDSPIRPFLPPEFDDRFDGIRVRDLLTHSSGITRDSTPGAWPEERYLRWIARSPVRPSRPTYTVMTSWLLLGKLLENAAGVSVSDLLRRYALDPFGLDLGMGPATAAHPRPLTIVDPRTGDPSPELWWADAPDVLERSWVGTGLRGTAPELARLGSILASRERRRGLDAVSQEAVDLLERPFGGGLSTDGEGLHSFEFSHGALAGSRWLGLPADRSGFGSDSGTGSFLLADPQRSLSVVYLSNVVREPVVSLARRSRLLKQVYDLLDAEDATVSGGRRHG